MYMYRFFFVLILIIQLSGCQSPCNCYSEKTQEISGNKISRPWHTTEINTGQIHAFLEKQKSDDIFGYHF